MKKNSNMQPSTMGTQIVSKNLQQEALKQLQM